MTNYADSFFEYQNSVRFSRHIPDSLPNIKILSGFLTKFRTVSRIPKFCPVFSPNSGQFPGYQNSVRFSRHIPDSLPNTKILSGFLAIFRTVSRIPKFCPLFSSYSLQFLGYHNSFRFSRHIPYSLPNTKILSGFLAIFRTVSPDTKILSGLKRKLYQYNHQYLILSAFRYFSMQLSEIDSLEN